MFAPIDFHSIPTTRRSLHRVAEHLLAGDLWRSTKKIGLRPTHGGFGQPETTTPEGRRQLRIEGDQLVVLEGDSERRTPLTTVADAAEFAGVQVGAPVGVYDLLTEEAARDPLDIDVDIALALGEFYRIGSRGLETFRSLHWTKNPTIAQLWPEHLDHASSMTSINFGVSPGDEGSDDPYLYVGPWDTAAVGRSESTFWNAAFGATRSWRDVHGSGDAATFFEEGFAEAERLTLEPENDV